jgi:hypothetical protein
VRSSLSFRRLSRSGCDPLRCTARRPRHRALGSPGRALGALIDAVRWGTVASADVTTLQAPFRSGIQIKDYYLEPVAKALRMPRVALLIADDVGLGKTIEAGLVVQLRHRARRVLVVCPASLTIKWREEMRAGRAQPGRPRRRRRRATMARRTAGAHASIWPARSSLRASRVIWLAKVAKAAASGPAGWVR